eukprot:gene1482-2850_t
MESDLITHNESRQIDDETLLRALSKGKKEWGRSKIMIVGEGRAGKTALTSSFIGKSFESTASTIGINQLTCDVKYAAISGDTGHWGVFQAPLKEFETALAKMIYDAKSKDGRKKIVYEHVMERKLDIDNDFVMKALADKVFTESKFILSVYDFGGQE